MPARSTNRPKSKRAGNGSCVAILPVADSRLRSVQGRTHRSVALVVVVDELLEVGEFFGGEDEGFGVDAGFEGIHGGDGFACDRGGAGGFLRVAAIGIYLTLRGHLGNSEMGSGLSYFEHILGDLGN